MKERRSKQLKGTAWRTDDVESSVSEMLNLRWFKNYLYAKWNKSDSERQTLYDLTYTWNVKKPNSWYRERIGACQSLGVGSRRRGKGVQNVQTSGYKINKLMAIEYSIASIVNHFVMYIWKWLRD